MPFTLNKVMLIGNLAFDPEIRQTPTGKTVGSMRVMTNRRWLDRNTNQYVEKAEGHNLVVWDRLAEIAQQYLRKGHKAYFEGHLETNNWEDKDGVKRYKTEMIVENMIMLERRQPPPPVMPNNAPLAATAPASNSQPTDFGNPASTPPPVFPTKAALAATPPPSPPLSPEDNSAPESTPQPTAEDATNPEPAEVKKEDVKINDLPF